MNASPSRVALVRNTRYQPDGLRQALDAALALIDLPMTQLVHPGARVLIKPYLRHGPMRNPESRMISHPAIIEATVRMVRDCGGQPFIGDDGARRLHDPPPHPEEMWLHLLAEESGAELVSFSKAGGRLVPSHLARPRHYLLSRAVLDADVVINLANAQLHPMFAWSGAVKNMFNTVIGAGSNQLFELLTDIDALEGSVADICALSRPNLSILDMTTVCPDSKAELWPMGLIGASTDPFALDSAAVQALGWAPERIGTITWGARLGVGQWERAHLALNGLQWDELPVLHEAQFVPKLPEPASPLAEAVRVLNKTTLRPRPLIDRTRCDRCGDCLQLCPLQAIHADAHGHPQIDYRACADCLVCVDGCAAHAIVPGHRGWVAAVQSPRRALRRAWRWAKTGHVWRFGQIALRWHLEKARPVRSARRPAVTPARKETMMSAPSSHPPAERREHGLALIVGAGPGLGSALAHRFAREGMDVALVARDGRRLDSLVDALQDSDVTVRAYACDVTEEQAVTRMVRDVCSELGVPRLAVYCIEHFSPGHVVDIETQAFIECWQVNCLGAFLVGREVGRAMLTRGSGTLIFTGATAALRGRDGYANMAVGKWGQRALAQCMARELGPKGIHVAHVVIDGGILRKGGSPLQWKRMSGLFPDEIAEAYLALHRQHPSAWTQEMDLRPWMEKF